MRVVEIHIEVSHGEGLVREFLLWQDRRKTMPYDIAGYAGAAQVRTGPSVSDELVAEFEVECGADGVSNKLRYSLSAEVVAGLAVGTYHYDTLLAPPGGEPYLFGRGTVKKGHGVTEWPT